MAARPGTRFTPAELAERLCRRLFARIDGDGGDGGEGDEGGEAPGEPAAVLDPACGDGALLAAAWKVGEPRGLRPEALFGIEVDAGLVRAARRRLARVAGERAAAHVVHADALDPRVAWPPGTHVVANPPWVSFSGRRAASREAVARTTRPTRGWPSLHGAFLERIARHAARHGTRAALLLPAPVCELDGYAPLRREVTRAMRLCAPPLELGESAFPGVVEPAVLLELEPRTPAGRGSAARWTRLGPAERELLAALEGFPRLPAGSFGDVGVHTGNAAAQLVVPGPRDGLPGIREGRDLAPYRLAAPRLALNVGLERVAGRRFRVGAAERHRAVPVLLRQTADRPKAALHTEPTYFRNSLLACTPPPGLDPAFVVAVLNGPVACAWHRLRFRDARQRAFPQVKVSHLATLPMPIAHRDDAPGLHDEVAAAARALSVAGGGDAATTASVEARVAAAYGLAPAVLARLRAVADGADGADGG